MKLADSSSSPLRDPALYVLVFLGGAIGTGLRYGLSLLIPGAAAGSGLGMAWHWGTFAANMLSCFVYAGLTAYMSQAAWIGKRRKELTSRGVGMGVCGGLSTMSTLALEWFTGVQAGGVGVASAMLYMVGSFACGLVAAFAGVWCGLWLSGPREEATVEAEVAEETANVANASNAVQGVR